MLKSDYSDPTFQNHGFITHIHHVIFNAGVYPGTENLLLEVYKIVLISNLPSTGGGGAKPRNLALFRKVIAPNTLISAGKWDLLNMWIEGVDYEDSSAGGSVSINPTNGNVHVVLTFGKLNTLNQVAFQTWEDLIPRASFARPIERLPVPGDGIDHTADLEALQRASEAQMTTIAAIELALGNISQESGELDANDRAALDWLAQLRRLFAM